MYSFALIVFTYLGATFLGSWKYRRDLKKNSPWPTARLICLLVVAVFLPVLAGNPRFVTMNWEGKVIVTSAILVLASICPFCAALGYLTPSLIDEYAAGDPAVAGKAYAINVLGCILGPLFACYVLLPEMSERYAMILLSLPFFAFYLLLRKSQPWRHQLGWGLAVTAALMASLFLVEDFETMLLRTRKKHGHPAGLRRHSHFLWRGTQQTPAGEWRRHDHPDARHQVHDPSADGLSSGPTRIGVDHLFRHGHQLPFGVELEC